uniref:BTB domain-containing protein n=1 Tax=Pinguiococcus pyrenoidosus TaxID=172671 RepID=A0A7R9UG27_9STRA
MHEYDLETQTWTPMLLEGDVPSGRSSLVAQVHRNSLYIFGGYNGKEVLNDFYEYRFQHLSIAPSAFLSEMRSLVNNQMFSDVTFIVDGIPIYATRAHLAARCEHFRAMLYGEMREASSEEIVIHDIRHDTFLKLLEYLYTDQVEDLTAESATPLLIAAEQYLLERLKGICEGIIRQSITVENVIGIFMAAHRHNALRLREIVLEYILANLEDVKRTRHFQELKDEPELLMEIIMRQQTPT